MSDEVVLDSGLSDFRKPEARERLRRFVQENRGAVGGADALRATGFGPTNVSELLDALDASETQVASLREELEQTQRMLGRAWGHVPMSARQTILNESEAGPSVEELLQVHAEGFGNGGPAAPPGETDA